jgi:hypothetical protein
MPHQEEKWVPLQLREQERGDKHIYPPFRRTGSNYENKQRNKNKNVLRRRLIGEESIQVSRLHPGRTAANATG